jgi:hypothetical protein
MAAETREVLVGYTWREVAQIRAGFPMPDGWFYRYEHMQGTDAVFMTKELIRGNDPFTSLQDVQSGQGFSTGLTVNTIGNISRKVGASAVLFARRAVTTNPLWVPERALETKREGPLTIYRAWCRSGSRQLAARGMYPARYLIEAIGNRQTDRFYLIMFETPAELWEQDKAIAEMMIDKKELDHTF